MAGEAIIEAWRGGIVESVHHAVVAVAEPGGELIAACGDSDLVTYPRSSLKPVQALALIETGAADAFGLDDRHIALACASHHGEPIHVELVRSWLAGIDADADELVCGAEPPLSQAALAALLAAGGRPTRLHHNCSGKHTGFLSVCRHCAWPSADYEEPAHPVQRRFLEALAELAGGPASTLGWDGCGLPAAALSVAATARAMARIAGQRDGSATRRAAMARITLAMARHPELVSGTGHATVALARVTNGRIVTKGGAEGYLVALGRDPGIGVAIKVKDGQGRATFPLLIELLASLGHLDAAELAALEAVRRPVVLNSRGIEVGRIEARLAA